MRKEQPFLPLTSKSVFGPSRKSKQKQWELYEWEAQAPQLCVIDLVSLKAPRLHCTWNWIVTRGLYRHSHNPLPILQQAPWQTGRTQADKPLSKQVHITVIAHCSPSLALIGFAHGSAGELSQSACFSAARATLLISNKMIPQTRVASICFTKHMPVSAVQWVRGSGPLEPL